ncbi:hypothetical protein ACTFIR_007799 [Dictyostelium discoideum]
MSKKNNKNDTVNSKVVKKSQPPPQQQQQKKQQPTKQQPQQPTKQQPQQPTKQQQPAKQQPTKQQQQPAKQQPAKQPAKQQPAKQQPAKQQPTKQQTQQPTKLTTKEKTIKKVEEKEEENVETTNNPMGIEKELFEEISTLQVEIENIGNKEMKQKLKLDLERDTQLSPLYAEREAILKNIPEFWSTCIFKHPILSALITDSKDISFLKHLNGFNVEMKENGNVKFTFTFANNSFIKNKQIWKEYVFDTDGVSTSCSPIQWKNGNDITKKKEGEDPSFFSWFSDQDDLEIFDIFKHEIWMFPMDFYSKKVEDDE